MDLSTLFAPHKKPINRTTYFVRSILNPQYATNPKIFPINIWPAVISVVSILINAPPAIKTPQNIAITAINIRQVLPIAPNSLNEINCLGNIKLGLNIINNPDKQSNIAKTLSAFTSCLKKHNNHKWNIYQSHKNTNGIKFHDTPNFTNNYIILTPSTTITPSLSIQKSTSTALYRMVQIMPISCWR